MAWTNGKPSILDTIKAEGRYEELLDKIKQMAQDGYSRNQIWLALGISENTFRKMLSENSDIAMSFLGGVRGRKRYQYDKIVALLEDTDNELPDSYRVERWLELHEQTIKEIEHLDDLEFARYKLDATYRHELKLKELECKNKIEVIKAGADVNNTGAGGVTLNFDVNRGGI